MLAKAGILRAFTALVLLWVSLASFASAAVNIPLDDAVLGPKNILVVTAPASGHANPLLVLAYELASRGHNVTFVTSTSYSVPEYGRNSTIHFHQFEETVPIIATLNKASKHISEPSSSVFSILSRFRGFRIAIGALSSFEYDVVQEVIKNVDTRSTDLIIGGFFLGPVVDVLNEVLGIPVVVHYLMIVLNYYSPSNLYLDSLTITPFDTTATAEMTVFSALKAIPLRIIPMLGRYIRWYERRQIFKWVKTTLSEYLPQVQGPPQPIVGLVSNEWGFHPAQLTNPSMRMGGIWLKEWLDSAERPVVYVSTGTVARPTNETLLAFFDAFSTTTEFQTVWSLKKDLQSNLKELLGDREWPKHVYVHHFVPQLAVLEHPSVKVFFTHGGWNSVSEGLWSGTPMLGMPFFGDQPYNVAQSVHMGLALDVDKSIMTSPDKAGTTHLIQEKLHRLIREPSFAEQSRQARRTFRAMGGVKKGANIVEEILKIGNTRAYAFPDNLDAVAAAFAILAASGAIAAFGTYKLGSWGFKRLFKSAPKQKIE
ncbi:uncharacterized protein BJ171DRAFT_532117 [Polychytrium aggregatum]|uniref:uncharacterized protein n=1 Tax=Polychytrium aggregatum TaxID=110093 RepID=UPI0022FEFDC8|nr:uncharacterized protein BJ171DRAFT_532117 [Polychytrium aggregatum]KAI9193204.1 hypothetical protein BJ171DRAFT_532117 [Polychytrium aggregatum]